MYILYKITNTVNGKTYIGVTKVGLEKRWKQHITNKRHSLLTQAIRKYGPEIFVKEVLATYDTKEECFQAEKALVTISKSTYNLAPGGDGGFHVTDVEAWKKKLRKARAGGRPALGMKHTEENKKFFAECNKRKIPKYPEKLPPTFKEAKDKLGISKTHYYRLIKRADSSEVC